jgi:hypothetical protein
LLLLTTLLLKKTIDSAPQTSRPLEGVAKASWPPAAAVVAAKPSPDGPGVRPRLKEPLARGPRATRRQQLDRGSRPMRRQQLPLAARGWEPSSSLSLTRGRLLWPRCNHHWGRQCRTPTSASSCPAVGEPDMCTTPLASPPMGMLLQTHVRRWSQWREKDEICSMWRTDRFLNQKGVPLFDYKASQQLSWK